MSRPTRIILLGICCSSLLVGCGQPRLDELQTYVDRVRARPPGPLEPIPEVPQVDTFLYQPGTRRDPFVMDDRTAQATTPRQGTGIAPDPLRRREELENFSLDALRMVGTLEQNETRWALIATPDGVLHRVRVGNYMGQNNGQIVQISPEGIALTEIVGQGPGSWREREAGVSLRQQ
jgi:type IV pilus assembly protein PilP